MNHGIVSLILLFDLSRSIILNLDVTLLLAPGRALSRVEDGNRLFDGYRDLDLRLWLQGLPIGVHEENRLLVYLNRQVELACTIRVKGYGVFNGLHSGEKSVALRTDVSFVYITNWSLSLEGFFDFGVRNVTSLKIVGLPDELLVI